MTDTPPDWTCPICHQQTDPIHATTHATRLPARLTTTEWLTWLPDLAGEARATKHAANPTEQTWTHTTRLGSPMPRQAEVAYLLDWSETHTGAPLPRLVQCSRIIWDAITPTMRRTHPLPGTDIPTWRTESRWLAGVWADALTVADEIEIDWVASEISDIGRLLAQAAHVVPEPRYRCPDCGELMHSTPGGWLVCNTGVHEYPGEGRILAQWTDRAPMTAEELCTELRITRTRFDHWSSRKQIAPLNPGSKPLYWEPLDVLRRLLALDPEDVGEPA